MGNSESVSIDTLFPTDLPSRDWVHFKAHGFSQPACGVIYRMADTVTNGMALGGIDTGCIDLETSGLFGYCTIFNSHIPRRGPLNLPFLGMSIAQQTWVFCDPSQMKQGWGGYQTGQDGVPISPILSNLDFKDIATAKEIHYWGHYPVADLEFDTDAPVSAGVRIWSPFLPGDVFSSMIPAIIFEVHLRNASDSLQSGTLGFSSPGPNEQEAGNQKFTRKMINGKLTGIEVSSADVSYAVGVIGKEQSRFGGELGSDSAAWKGIADRLPELNPSDSGSSAAVDFTLEAGQAKVIRIVLTWHAPKWNGVGQPGVVEVYKNYSGEPRTFTHMYAKHYPSAEMTACLVASKHSTLLKRILAWQQVIYTENKLPVWLRDSLINVLYMVTEDGYWAQKFPPLPDWVREDDGLFGMNECPRGCPQIECIPCSFYGSLPIAYFFPELELSTLRGYKGYQFPDGAPAWIFGGCTDRTPFIDFAYPARGYQFASNGISLASLVDQFLMCHDTPDKRYLKEFYPMVKKCMIWTVSLRNTPGYTIGEKIISMPDPESKESLTPPTEWFEAAAPGWCGMTAHIAGLHIAQLRIASRMARDIGDTEFADQCEDWIKASGEAAENRLWDQRGYYLNYFEPDTGQKSEFVFGYQLDGEWITDHHGLQGTFPKERVITVLETIKRCNIAITKYGAVNYANPDATPIRQAATGTWDYGTYSYFPPEALMLAMTYMYNGHREFGLELARKVWHNLICLQGYTWDMPNIMRGDVDTGERTFGNDYYQDMMLWSLPAVIDAVDLSAPVKPDGLVDRIIHAASE